MARGKKRRRLQEQEQEQEEEDEDRLSSLPDGVLGDIVSLLPTRAGARTQVLSSRWRHIWRSADAPLNLDVDDDGHDGSVHRARILAGHIPHILSTHPGPNCRRFVMPRRRCYPNGNGDIDGDDAFSNDLLLPSVLNHRFSHTLSVVCFRACRFPSDGNNDGCQFQLPLLKQLTLSEVTISETSLHALLAGCPVLESLLLHHNAGFSQLRIVSSSLRSIGVDTEPIDRQALVLRKLVIEDAPRLERLLYFGLYYTKISVISAPVLTVLGQDIFSSIFPDMIQFGAYQGSLAFDMSWVVRSVKVLAFYTRGAVFMDNLGNFINMFKCFPHLEKLYIKITSVVGNDWRTYHQLLSTVDLRLRKIVIRNYRGNKFHINLARLLLSNARVLESMRFDLGFPNVTTKWIQRQHKLFETMERASGCAQFDFVSTSRLIEPLDDRRAEQVHDLLADPFDRFHY